MKTPTPTLPVPLACLILATGCTSRIVSIPLSPPAPRDGGAPPQAAINSREGITYCLPKTLVRITVRFDLLVEAPAKEPPPSSRYALLVLSDTAPVSVEALLRPDPGQAYLLCTRDSSLTELSDYKVALTDEGYLQAVNSTYEDRTAEVVGNVVASGLNLARIGFGLLARPRELRELQKTSHSVVLTTTRPIEDFLPGAQTQIRSGDVLGAIQQSPSASHPVFGQELTDLFKAITEGTVPPGLQASFPGFRWYPGQEQPAFTVGLEVASATPGADSRTVATMIGGPAQAIPGVVYRVPRPGRLQVSMDGHSTWETQVDVYQLGIVGYKEVRSRTFSKRVDKLAFRNGMLVTHERNATSAAAGATKLFSDQTASLKTALADLDATTAPALARNRDLQLKQVERDAVDRQLATNQERLARAATPEELASALAERDGLTKQKIQIEAQMDALRRGLTLPAVN